jgi:hypothetical protein
MSASLSVSAENLTNDTVKTSEKCIDLIVYFESKRRLTPEIFLRLQLRSVLASGRLKHLLFTLT